MKAHGIGVMVELDAHHRNGRPVAKLVSVDMIIRDATTTGHRQVVREMVLSLQRIEQRR